ncbi:MAG: phenylalanine--tRNA ligase subunit beta [Desulfosalsimonadaceae bacterium]
MKISLDWLHQYVDIDTTPAELADMLTMSGFEVEAVMDPYEHLKGVITGKIRDINPHPDADRLACCSVDTGDRIRAIVCGAPNIAKEMTVPCALPDTLLPSGIRVESGSIRGQVSEGMLCSESELGLGTDASGVMQIEDAFSPGMPLTEALCLSDTVFEIGLTPNRPDCLSVIGIAREVAALLDKKLKRPDAVIRESDSDIREMTSVSIQNPQMCPRYSARLLTGITVQTSPAWLQRRLISIGIKPINNVVDITNYVMMETGQPLHAFDFNRLSGKRIVVRTCLSEAEKTFTTLDGKQRRMDDEALMICDGQEPVAVAGVMGGENSEIGDLTTDVLIESAHFDPVSIRKTAKKLGLSTDASYRFERGVDPEGTVFAMNRAAALMVETAGGTIAGGMIDEYPGRQTIEPIRLSAERTNRHLGTGLTAETIAGHLAAIEFIVTPKDQDAMDVLRPSFRVDVSRPEDLMEEVARLSGYNNIETTFPAVSAKTEPPLRSFALKSEIREMMVGFGFNEAIHYSFTGKNGERLEIPEDDVRQKELLVLNPISESQSIMRTTLIASLLEACQKNIFRQERDLKFFELGKAFYSHGPESLPDETGLLSAVWTGARRPPLWHEKPVSCDFYDIKGILESLFSALKIKDVAYRQAEEALCSYSRPGRSAAIRAGNLEIGIVGEIKPSVLHRFDIHQPVFAFEINIDLLMSLVPEDIGFTPIPRFPATSRDMTLIMDETVPAADVVRTIDALQVGIIEDITIFDVYRGKPIEEGKKSLSIRITYRSHEQTLEDGPVNALHQEITEKLLSAFDAGLPE